MSDAELPALVGELRCVHHKMVDLVCASCGKSARQIAIEDGPGYVPPARSEPVCRWCHRTKGAHLSPEQPNRPRARMPCLGWQEHFSPETSAPSPSDAASAPSMSDKPAIVITKSCSFCDKTSREVRKLIERETGNVRICDECIWLSNQLLKGEPDPSGTGLAIIDAARLAVVRELWKLHIDRRDTHMTDTLYEYERLAKERLGQ